MEFSAFFDLTTNNLGDRVIYLKYFLFIKYDNKIYIEVKSVGYIIIPFEELMKNKILKMYYELSLLLVKDKNMFVENISFSDNGDRIWDDEITKIYKGERSCFVDCAYILNNVIKTDKQYCYYNINPFELIDSYYGKPMVVDTFTKIASFNYNFKVRIGYEVSGFEKRLINYTNLAIAYNATLMEKEFDELSAIEDDKLTILKLIAFNDKNDMNSDIFQVIYNNLVSAKRTNIYAPYLANLSNDKNLTITQIICL